MSGYAHVRNGSTGRHRGSTGRCPLCAHKQTFAIRLVQKAYVTCLDLGEAGALFTRGWERKVEMVGDVAKKTKQEINTVWIYPPKAERAAALASADPERVTDVAGFF
jgi:NADH dehydrogenase FAD-containing subunit